MWIERGNNKQVDKRRERNFNTTYTNYWTVKKLIEKAERSHLSPRKSQFKSHWKLCNNEKKQRLKRNNLSK